MVRQFPVIKPQPAMVPGRAIRFNRKRPVWGESQPWVGCVVPVASAYSETMNPGLVCVVSGLASARITRRRIRAPGPQLQQRRRQPAGRRRRHGAQGRVGGGGLTAALRADVLRLIDSLNGVNTSRSCVGTQPDRPFSFPIRTVVAVATEEHQVQNSGYDGKAQEKQEQDRRAARFFSRSSTVSAIHIWTDDVLSHGGKRL